MGCPEKVDGVGVPAAWLMVRETGVTPTALKVTTFDLAAPVFGSEVTETDWSPVWDGAERYMLSPLPSPQGMVVMGIAYEIVQEVLEDTDTDTAVPSASRLMVVGLMVR